VLLKETAAVTAVSSIDPARFLHEHLQSASPDLLPEMMTTFVNTLMSAEADAICGAPYATSSPERTNMRNGYRRREFDTRTGTLELAIPKLRSGSCFPDWLLERRRGDLRPFRAGPRAGEGGRSGGHVLDRHASEKTMSARIGINGFGRIGRDYLRYVLAAEDSDVEVVAVNDITDSATMARLLRQDSTFGPLRREVEDLGDAIAVDGHKIAVSSERDPAQLAWRHHGVQIVIESTGKLKTRDSASAHLAAGASTVLLSSPGKGMDATIVMGVNDETYDPSRHHLISKTSCTTNCVAPMVKVLLDSFDIEQGFMTTVHAYTGDQNLLDGPHKDPRRARAAAVNIIPTTTGAARAVGEVIPAMQGRLDGVALRVPVVDGSLVDLAVLLGREVTVAEVNAAFEAAGAAGPLTGRLRYTTEPLVSSDVIGDSASCVFDAALTQATGRMAKVFGWYDNEWGYTARLVDLTRLVASAG
jgi:glyceraldehyde 3-phosphate dehydrogenase